MKDAQELVGGRMVRAFFIPVIESIELGQHDPAGKAQQKDEELDAMANRVARAAAAEENEGDGEAHRQAGDVGQQQGTTDEPAATSRARNRGALLEQLERALVKDEALPAVKAGAQDRFEGAQSPITVLICKLPLSPLWWPH